MILCKPKQKEEIILCLQFVSSTDILSAPSVISND